MEMASNRNAFHLATLASSASSSSPAPSSSPFFKKKKTETNGRIQTNRKGTGDSRRTAFDLGGDADDEREFSGICGDDEFGDRGGCSFLPVPLSPTRYVLEHQVVALYPDYRGNLAVIPDAAGCAFADAFSREAWLAKAKWGVNQNQKPITQDTLFDVSCRPGLDEAILNTGAEPIRDGDNLFVRIPDSRDLQAQRDRLPYSQRLPVSDRASDAPLFATYGLAPGSIDPVARYQSLLEKYRKRYAAGAPTGTEFNLMVEHTERTVVCGLAALAVAFFRELQDNTEFYRGVSELERYFEPVLPTATEKVLPVLRNSPLFLSQRGVAFQSTVVEGAQRLLANLSPESPMATVTQAHEQGKHDLTEAKTGELFRVVLY